MIYRITFGNTCPRCVHQDIEENEREFIKEHDCPFLGTSDKGIIWKCICCEHHENMCAKFYIPEHYKDLIKELKASYPNK